MSTSWELENTILMQLNYKEKVFQMLIVNLESHFERGVEAVWTSRGLFEFMPSQ